MMLAAPEFVIAEVIELLHEIEVAAELQHRVLTDRVMRGEEGSEFQARHGWSLRDFAFYRMAGAKLRGGASQGNRGDHPARHGCRADCTDMPPPGILPAILHRKESAATVSSDSRRPARRFCRLRP